MLHNSSCLYELQESCCIADEQVVIHYNNEEEMCVVSSKFEIERD